MTEKRKADEHTETPDPKRRKKKGEIATAGVGVFAIVRRHTKIFTEEVAQLKFLAADAKAAREWGEKWAPTRARQLLFMDRGRPVRIAWCVREVRAGEAAPDPDWNDCTDYVSQQPKVEPEPKKGEPAAWYSERIDKLTDEELAALFNRDLSEGKHKFIRSNVALWLDRLANRSGRKSDPNYLASHVRNLISHRDWTKRDCLNLLVRMGLVPVLLPGENYWALPLNAHFLGVDGHVFLFDE